MHKRLILFALILVASLIIPAAVLAQTYSFELEREVVNVFWNEDGTASIDYVFVFDNDPFASAIDFVDVGLPNPNYDIDSIFADVNGQPVTNIEPSPFVDPGVAIGLGQHSIPPGETGQVHVFIGTVNRVLREDSEDDEYASAVFSPTWFGSEFVHGTTDMTVIFHLPPGVGPEEPRWHLSPAGWPEEPETGFDEDGRVTYTWRNPSASGSEQYLFGASFPKQYVPASAIVQPGLLETLGISEDALIGFLICGSVGFFVVLGIIMGIVGSQRRKLQYLPPKVSIEGHGIKRGLTAVEAAILLEQPLDKVLTMILFSVIKKGAAQVTRREPLELEVSRPLPENLHPYEQQFLQAFEKDRRARQKDLQEMTVDLVKSVSNKMKGFSRPETVAYYREIMDRAWAQVEAADTPEVKSEKYEEVMEWTMLDRDYEDRTRRVFRGGPVFVPVWWPRYDPGYGRGPASIPTSTPGMPAGAGPSLPHLPGSDFAASMVRGVQDFSSSVIGNLSEFTGRVTDRTNPVPVATTTSGGRRGGGGGGCACACACAGCACACAGGGR